MSSNVFEGSDFTQSEDIVLIIENSDLFNDMDIFPGRLNKFKELMQGFIAKRLEVDYRDRYYLIVYGKDQLRSPLEEPESFSQTLVTQIDEIFSNVAPLQAPTADTWAINLLKALQSGIQKCISVFKKIRNKTLRLIVVTNHLFSLSEEIKSKVQQIVERTAQRLDIIIDILFIAGTKPVRVFEYENILKQVTDMTGGEYFQITNVREFEEAFQAISKKKEVLKKTYLGERVYAEEKQFLEIIASDLEKVTEMLSEADLKCNICFKNACTCEISDSYEHIRRCPSCGKIMHACCAGKWAEQQNSKEDHIGFPNVFRCPYCFYLLKVPREFVNFDQVLSMLQEKWIKQKEQEDLQQKQQQQKEQEIKEFMGEVVEQRSEEEKIIAWLTKNLPDKNRREIKRLCDDITVIKDIEERRSFIDYLKFKEGIEDDSSPI